MNEVLKIEFESLKADMIALYLQKGMKASGQFANELEVRITDNKAQLVGMNYTEQLEFGRRSGKFPPIQAIKQWIQDKGIAKQTRDNISESSLAFLIARKIAREGWKRERHGGVELVSEVVTPERMQSIINKVGEAALLSEIKLITEQLKAIVV